MYPSKKVKTGFFKKCCYGVQYVFQKPFQNQNQISFCKLLELLCCVKNQIGLPSQQQLEIELPLLKPDFKHPQQNQLKITWLGHSTFVLQMKNFNFMIDPVFSKRCSPFSFIGTKRYRPIPIRFEQLPKIDGVLISHDHYDHFDQHFAQKLINRDNPFYFIGSQSNDLFKKKDKVIQMDWHQTFKISQNLKVKFVPVKHWGIRWINDFLKRLWGGFIIYWDDKKIFYAGDTGFDQNYFKWLGKSEGPFDLAILPIGAYHPRKYFQNFHIDPKQAVQIHKLLSAKKSIGCHWGTFPLTYEPYKEPRQLLKAILKEQNLGQDCFITMGHGQTIKI